MILDPHSLNRMAKGLRIHAQAASAAAVSIVSDPRLVAEQLAIASECLGAATALDNIAAQLGPRQEVQHAA